MQTERFALLKKENRNAWAATAVAIVIVCILFFCRSAVIEGVYPVERAKNIFQRQVVSRLRGMLRGAAAEVECSRLRSQLGLLVAVESDNARYEKEIDRLRNVLGYVEAKKNGYIAAEVLSEDGGAAAAKKSIRVGKGSLAGVTKGAVVVSAEGLVGKVTSLTPHTAEVALITDPAIKVSCSIEGRKRVLGVLSGGTSGFIEIKHMTEGAEIADRARVFTSGLGGVYPPGIFIGTLSGKNLVESAVEFEELQDVFIRCEK